MERGHPLKVGTSDMNAVAVAENLKDFIVNLFKKIMEYISKGFSNLIDFLDLEPQVDVDPTVRTDV